MTKRTATSVEPASRPRKYYTTTAPLSEEELAARRANIEANSFIHKELYEFMSRDLNEDEGHIFAFKLAAERKFIGSLSPLPPRHVLDGISDIIGKYKYDLFLKRIVKKSELLGNICLEFEVKSEDLLHKALTRQFGLSAEMADRLRTDVEQLILSASSNPYNTTELPTDPPKYKYTPRMTGGIVKYLEDNWSDFIKRGLLSRPDLKRIDPPAEAALKNFLRTGGTLPASLYVPTKSEMIDRQVDVMGGAKRVNLAAKLDNAVRRRTPKEHP